MNKHSSYVGNSILIYDKDGENLLRTTVVSHDIAELHVVLEEWPPELRVDEMCRLLILSEPTPHEYHGRLRHEFGESFLALFKGKERESRDAARYTVNFKAHIEDLIFEGQEYSMFEPVEILILNISTSGMRLRAPLNTMNLGDKFKTRVIINRKAKILFAQVVNINDATEKHLDYGCRFLLSVGSLV